VIEERAFSQSTKSELELIGHKVLPYKHRTIGSANGILIDADGYWGGPDPRSENSAIGY
jgi:gamma-glutamyltranspeptidase